MTLTAHAIVGAGIAATIPAHPVLGVSLAFASHFLVDAIPHYDYQIRSASINPNLGGPLRFDTPLFIDLGSIALDGLFGLLLAFILFSTPTQWPLVLAAGFAGQLPDALQFVYLKSKAEPLVTLQKFHHWIHTKEHLRGHLVFGVISQVAFLIAFVGLVHLVA